MEKIKEYPGVSFDAIKAELLQDEETCIEYEKLRPRYEIISQMLDTGKE